MWSSVFSTGNNDAVVLLTKSSHAHLIEGKTYLIQSKSAARAWRKVQHYTFDMQLYNANVSIYPMMGAAYEPWSLDLRRGKISNDFIEFYLMYFQRTSLPLPDNSGVHRLKVKSWSKRPLRPGKLSPRFWLAVKMFPIVRRFHQSKPL